MRCGFEVETLKGKDVEDMNILNWPTLEKRLEDFEKSAELDEMMYVYCREGSASLSAEGEEDTTISAGAGPSAQCPCIPCAHGCSAVLFRPAGQLVIVNDGAVRWTDISEGGVTLLSTVTPILDADKAAEVAAKGEESPPEDLSLKEAAMVS